MFQSMLFFSMKRVIWGKRAWVSRYGKSQWTFIVIENAKRNWGRGEILCPQLSEDYPSSHLSFSIREPEQSLYERLSYKILSFLFFPLSSKTEYTQYKRKKPTCVIEIWSCSFHNQLYHIFKVLCEINLYILNN